MENELETLRLIEDIIKPETATEVMIMNDSEFIEGAMLGEPRSGHPEGKIIYHIEEVLNNVSKCASVEYAMESRKTLRLISLVHDTFKHKVNYSKPKVGDNHHAMIARRFAEKYTTDRITLDIIELHDEAYNAWCMGNRKGNWKGAEERAKRLIQHFGDWLVLYKTFYWCDNNTGDKAQDCFEWFEEQVRLYNSI
jgi:hypothetical protein